MTERVMNESRNEGATPRVMPARESWHHSFVEYWFDDGMRVNYV